MSPWKPVSILKKCVFSDAIEVITKSKSQIESSRIFLNSLELHFYYVFFATRQIKTKRLEKD